MGSRQTPDNTEATVARFIEHLRKNQMSEQTVRAYACDVNGFLHRATAGSTSVDLNSIVAMQTNDIEDYLQNLARAGAKFATVRRTSCALKNFFLFLVHQGVIKHNPAAALRVRALQSAMLSPDQIVSVFRHFDRCQASSEASNAIRYQRDELILFLMMFYGVRQCQICTLKLSAIQTSDRTVSLIISTISTLHLHAQVLRKLRAYLESRNSSSDTIFLESLGKKTMNYWGVRHLLNDLSQALQIDCSPKSLHTTYLHLQRHQEIREPLIRQILSIGSSHKYGATPNA
jgi:site-specific recombinase XerD